MRHGRRSTLSAGPKPARSGSPPTRRGQIRWLPVRGRGYGPSVTWHGPARPVGHGPAAARGLGARSALEDKPALSGPLRGRIVSAPALSERSRGQIASAFETNQLDRGLEPDASTAEVVDLAVLFPTRERLPRRGPTRRRPAPARPDAARRGPTRPDPTRRRPAPARPGAARSDPAQPGGHDLGTPPISKTRVVSRRCTFSETAPRRARSGSTGPVRRAHGASHRGHR